MDLWIERSEPAAEGVAMGFTVKLNPLWLAEWLHRLLPLSLVRLAKK